MRILAVMLFATMMLVYARRSVTGTPARVILLLAMETYAHVTCHRAMEIRVRVTLNATPIFAHVMDIVMRTPHRKAFNENHAGRISRV